jgi:hypothetical protein
MGMLRIKILRDGPRKESGDVTIQPVSGAGPATVRDSPQQRYDILTGNFGNPRFAPPAYELAPDHRFDFGGSSQLADVAGDKIFGHNFEGICHSARLSFPRGPLGQLLRKIRARPLARPHGPERAP